MEMNHLFKVYFYVIFFPLMACMSHVIMKFSFSHIYVVLYTQGCCLNLCRVLVFFGRVVSGFFVGFLFFF